MLIVMTVTAAVLAGSLRAQAPVANDVAWMSGCWDLTRSGRHVTETWTAAEGGTLLGMSRTVASGKTLEWEFMLIREATGGLEYVAKPSGQPEAVFTSRSASPNEVVFENLAHDFPKRILYKREGEVLTAAIEGPVNGKNRRVEFVYRKAACGA